MSLCLRGIFMVTVLRIGHRPERDKRITTHVCLVARAFGAQRILVDTADRELEVNFAGVGERFGEGVVLETGVKWRRAIEDWQGTIVHLTMYGLRLEEAMIDIKEHTGAEDVLVIVGAEKVPGEVYKAADFNVSVGNQPHSEVAALALFLDRLFDGRALRNFGGKMKIIPSNEGKVVEDRGD